MILGAGGYNIYPREIEDVLYQHPKVLEAAAVGIPVEGKGERIKVFIILKPGEEATEEETIDFCRERLAPYKRVRRLEFSDLPKTISGKIRRVELRDQETRRLGTATPPAPAGQRGVTEFWEEDFPDLKS